MQRFVPTVALLALVATGCQTGETKQLSEYRTVAADPLRNTELARQHNAKGVESINSGNLEQAEKELKSALAADMFFGPAHNNLGTVYHKQKKLYLAAWEFQYAVKLMPNRAEPKNNLGAIFEAVGKLDEAAKWYEEALEIESDTPEIIGNLARVYVRANRNDDRTRELLADVVLKDQRPEWNDWAREHLTKMGGPLPTATAQPTPTTQPATIE